ncbi:MAG TPA: glycosyl transferase [Sphingomicrobium sp.]|nr:glycosyl transferase [Sphingomicrobium sp.]
MARRHGVRVEVLSGSRAGLAFVKNYDPDGLLDLVHLPTPSLRRDGLFSPPPRWLTLRLHWRRFQANDLVVTTECTTEYLKLETPFDKPMIRMRHGAGDREGGYRRKIASFDGVIVNGAKDRQRMIALGLMPPERIAVCGYCKFEAISPPYDPFGDGKPLVLYNPHFDPTVSSWYEHRRQVLAAMAALPDWNFIVAPHVKVAKGRSLGRSPAPNVIIDPGSVHAIDMSYAAAAAVYVGDASSQIYEFVRTPRPCLFLNLDRRPWRDDPHFAHWRFGQVIDDVSELGDALARGATLQPRFERVQREALARSTDPSPVPASARHADAILHFARHGEFARYALDPILAANSNSRARRRLSATAR